MPDFGTGSNSQGGELDFKVIGGDFVSHREGKDLSKGVDLVDKDVNWSFHSWNELVLLNVEDRYLSTGLVLTNIALCLFFLVALTPLGGTIVYRFFIWPGWPRRFLAKFSGGQTLIGAANPNLLNRLKAGLKAAPTGEQALSLNALADLERLSRLKDSGVLSEIEFENQKKLILG